jgi:hypothetical protein
LGDQVIDLYALAQGGYLKDVLADAEVLNQKTLNAFIALGKPVTNAVRQKIQALFSEENAAQKDSLSAYLVPVAEAGNAYASSHSELHRFLQQSRACHQCGNDVPRSE